MLVPPDDGHLGARTSPQDWVPMFEEQARRGEFGGRRFRTADGECGASFPSGFPLRSLWLPPRRLPFPGDGALAMPVGMVHVECWLMLSEDCHCNFGILDA